MEKNVRNNYWDNIKGFLIILTVFAHILFQLQAGSDVIDNIVDYIYMFHMPAFVFVSGYFGKSERSRSFGSIMKLIFLYFIFNSVYGFIFGFGSLLKPMYSFWYLIALVAWRLTAHYIAKFKEINLILCLVAVFAGFFPSVDNTFAAARIICFYPFYMAGYQLSEEKSAALENGGKKRFLIGLACLAAAGAGAFFADGFFDYSDEALQMSGYDAPVDSFGRIALFVIAFLMIFALRNLSPRRKIPFVAMAGRNSLSIFIFHRYFTLKISPFIAELGDVPIIIISLLSALLICLVFGNDFVAGLLESFARSGAEIFTKDGKFCFSKLAALAVALGFVVSVVVNAYSGLTLDSLINGANGDAGYSDESDPVLYPVMSARQKAELDGAFRLTFAGDLILLEDQVKRARRGEEYDFSDVFEYAERYISSADFAVGVFEGPMAGAEAGYSSGNFDDGKEIYLNFPDSFCSAVKNAGFDLVTTANNHVLDKGEEGALRTLDVLDAAGLDHTGSYRSEQEKRGNRVKLVEAGGIRFAVLAYTYGSNYREVSELCGGDISYITSVITGTSGELFEQCRANVERDFAEARALSPDLIIVLPHIGTQFQNEPDEEQSVWFEIFRENGADIILGDHPHVVEPANIREYGGKDVFTAYCPGNFANIYRENQGDTSMLVDVFIDRGTKTVIGGGIVPLYTQSPADGNYRALPIYEIQNNAKLRSELSTDDIKRAAEANETVTRVVFGKEMDITSVTERYYFDKNGFVRLPVGALTLTAEMKNGTLYKAMEKAASVCFIGDSVTEGTKNGGCPWYEPIAALFPEKTLYNYSKGGCTVSYMTERADEIPAAELYVIALGTNDVRYRNSEICAMTAADFTAETDRLRTKLSEKAPNAAFVFIAPWYSTDGDAFCALSFSEKTKLNDEYSKALEKYCETHGLGFINANGFIKEKLTEHPDREYLLDHIHPNSAQGVLMYSEAVLRSGEQEVRGER